MEIKIPEYPRSTAVSMDVRPVLHQLFKKLRSPISEFTFANLFLFRKTHNYRVSVLKGGLHVITGNDNGKTFFMLPFGIPDGDTLSVLFKDYSFMKAATESQARELEEKGFYVVEDRDNFDYLYFREELSELSGRKFHRKKNLVNFFMGAYSCEGKPLIDKYINDALEVLEKWQAAQEDKGDYQAAKEALMMCDPLALCGFMYYVEGKPAAWVLGEELTPDTFVIHFEKGVDEYKGLLQYVNKSFAELLPAKYKFINREQDLGHEGLRKSKLSYRPAGFVKKYKVSDGQ